MAAIVSSSWDVAPWPVMITTRQERVGVRATS
jgi:hypothetical protein